MLKQAGFTLMELVVVMIILAILAGSIGARLAAGTSGAIKEEARRLALVLQTAQEQSVLQGTLYALRFNSSGYYFLTLNEKGELEKMEKDALLQARDFPEPLQIESAVVDEKTLNIEDDSLLFTPTGAIPMISITLKQNNQRWRIESGADGSVTSSQTDA
jgi:general secretion pathway protein H